MCSGNGSVPSAPTFHKAKRAKTMIEPKAFIADSDTQLPLSDFGALRLREPSATSNLFSQHHPITTNKQQPHLLHSHLKQTLTLYLRVFLHLFIRGFFCHVDVMASSLVELIHLQGWRWSDATKPFKSHALCSLLHLHSIFSITNSINWRGCGVRWDGFHLQKGNYFSFSINIFILYDLLSHNITYPVVKKRDLPKNSTTLDTVSFW